jgi:glycerol-3-phosphate acyltransferase PlsX
MIKIAIDAMGGDFAPKEQVEGAMLAVARIPDIELTLYGDEQRINEYLTNSERIRVVHTSSVIQMDEDDPIKAIRNNDQSSIALALSSVRTKENDAVISAGATQALIAGAHILVGRLKGMKRTAIAPVIPSLDGRGTIILDAGANLNIKPEFMLQQALFGAIYASEVLGREKPKVGLANIGEEEMKGRPIDIEVHQLLKEQTAFEFIGNVEPKKILNPGCDVLISDGFTMDIIMKTLEGTAKGMGVMLKQELTRNFIGKIMSLFLINHLKRFKKRLSAEDIGGAMIYGLRGVVLKAQGASKAYGFSQGIKRAAEVVRNDVLNKVTKELSNVQIHTGTTTK